ncbi:hypothetical protein [Allosphingosinicella sp.]|jgi:hypothetical protein|uniref:hypothetical protein n=1 Tax=Allosphingosinicella sp. TaxID=2823234 RepID=UPI002F1BAB08
MKDFFVRLLEKPALYIFTMGLLCVVLGAAGTISFQGETIAVADPAWRIALAVAGLALAGLGAALIARDTRNPRPSQPFRLDYDIFIASPMAALDDPAAYHAQRQEVAAITEALHSHAGIEKVYDAGTKIPAANEAGEKMGAVKWDPKDFAAEVDLEALRHSKYFLLIYPHRIASSVLFEAGYALGMGKPAVYVVRKRDQLPYLMQELNNLSRIYPQVRIWECDDTAAIVERIRQTGTRMFTADVPAPDC